MEVMSQAFTQVHRNLIDVKNLSCGERRELVSLGILSPDGTKLLPARDYLGMAEPVPREAMSSEAVLNEAHDYGSAFSRGLRVPLGDYTLLFISGTASVDDHGLTVHPGDLKAQCWRTYRNITALLEGQGAGWRDVVKCTCYLRDIERDYDEFNQVRTAFFDWIGLRPYPSSVGIQARLCRENLLVEIEALAIVRTTA
jgi:2-iminobutanoate/2-iminopropanoate deaminase